jgi:hypothetical protein
MCLTASQVIPTCAPTRGFLPETILTSVFAAASRHASSHPAAGLDTGREGAQALAHGLSAALTGAAVFLGLALVVALDAWLGRREITAVTPDIPGGQAPP